MRFFAKILERATVFEPAVAGLFFVLFHRIFRSILLARGKELGGLTIRSNWPWQRITIGIDSTADAHPLPG